MLDWKIVCDGFISFFYTCLQFSKNLLKKEWYMVCDHKWMEIFIETIYTFELSNCKFCKFKVLYFVTLEFLSFDTCKKNLKRLWN